MSSLCSLLDFVIPKEGNFYNRTIKIIYEKMSLSEWISHRVMGVPSLTFWRAVASA